MNTFMLIVEVVIVLLLLWAIIIIVKNPKEIFIGIPVFIFHRVVEKILTLIKLITSPIWLPIYLLDSVYNWRIFELKFFKFFGRYDNIVENNKPDTSYKQHDEKRIDSEKFSWYFISSFDNSKAIIESIKQNLNNITEEDFKCTDKTIRGFSIVQVHDLSLYQYHYTIQALDNDFEKFTNVGFAQSPKISFFSISDISTLNNIIGETSKGERYSFNLVDGQENHLSINKDIKIPRSHSYKTYYDVIKKP